MALDKSTYEQMLEHNAKLQVKLRRFRSKHFVAHYYLFKSSHQAHEIAQRINALHEPIMADVPIRTSEIVLFIQRSVYQQTNLFDVMNEIIVKCGGRRYRYYPNHNETLRSVGIEKHFAIQMTPIDITFSYQGKPIGNLNYETQELSLSFRQPLRMIMVLQLIQKQFHIGNTFFE